MENELLLLERSLVKIVAVVREIKSNYVEYLPLVALDRIGCHAFVRVDLRVLPFLDFATRALALFLPKMPAQFCFGGLDQSHRGRIKLYQALAIFVCHLLEKVGGEISGEIEAARLDAGRHRVKIKSPWHAEQQLSLDLLFPFDDLERCGYYRIVFGDQRMMRLRYRLPSEIHL